MLSAVSVCPSVNLEVLGGKRQAFFLLPRSLLALSLSMSICFFNMLCRLSHDRRVLFWISLYDVGGGGNHPVK